jgi:hypothetical protein
MSALDEVLKHYENTKQTTEDLPREETFEETELLTDYILNGNLQAIYDYYDLKDKLDKEWVDRQMYHNEDLGFYSTL